MGSLSIRLFKSVDVPDLTGGASTVPLPIWFPPTPGAADPLCVADLVPDQPDQLSRQDRNQGHTLPSTGTKTGCIRNVVRSGAVLCGAR